VVAHGPNVVLGLPETATLDARSRVERVDDTPAEDVLGDGRRRDEQVARHRRHLGLARTRLAEEKPKSWTGGAKRSRRCHREVQLKCVRQQEHAVERRPALELGERNGAELVDERARPIIENPIDRDVVGDAEREVQVGEAIAFVDCERAHRGSGQDAVILLREP
jgi:hypothetical protein